MSTDLEYLPASERVALAFTDLLLSLPSATPLRDAVYPKAVEVASRWIVAEQDGDLEDATDEFAAALTQFFFEGLGDVIRKRDALYGD